MKVTLFGALVLSLGSSQPAAQQPATAQTTAAQAIAEAADPADCVKALRAFVSKRQQEVRPPTGFTAELLKQVDGEKHALAGTCVARFEATKIKDAQLSGLAELYTEARMPAEAQATLERALAATLPAADRANTLISAMNAVFSQPKSDARNARLEAMVDELDANAGATLDQKWTAHSRMAGYYRGDDIDAGIIKHGRWMAETAKSFTPDQRTKYGSRLISSQVSVAEALAGQGMNDEALALLRRTGAEWKDIPRSSEQITPVLERYLLVGTPAAAIKAPRWLNAPAGVTEMPMTGAVTLLEFTAHWCGPCRESYPGVNRLRQQFGPQGFRVVMATRYYGYFSSERFLTPEDELKRDAEYFKSYQLDVPVAVGDQVSVKVVDGKVTYVPGPDPNDTSYKVGGIPQIHLIDKQGRIRLIMVGYDDANEPKLADIIRKLLAEK